MLELRQTVRRLWRAPGFTLAIALTLAIGIGATIAIFTVVNGILLRPLPFPESDRLVSLTHRVPERGNSVPASTAIYFTYRDNNRAVGGRRLLPSEDRGSRNLSPTLNV